MEEGGHYYTVYYTSLAVGFNEKIAYRHAVLAQMPDEVGRMDAANMQIKEGTGFPEVDFNGKRRYVPINERYGVQYGLHSLPGNDLGDKIISSDYQRKFTTQQLLAESPVSLKFGLLLHRLGDSYAHSRMNNQSVMYTVTRKSSVNVINMGDKKYDYGHLADGHDPDFGFLRKDLFYNYLKNLHEVLSAKLKTNQKYKRENSTPRQYHEVKGDFELMFNKISNRAVQEERRVQEILNRNAEYPMAAPKTTNDTMGRWLIEEIRASSLRTLRIDMGDYHPEKEDAMPLNKFLGKHPELKALNIDNKSLVDTIESMVPGGGKDLLKPPPPVDLDLNPMYYGP